MSDGRKLNDSDVARLEKNIVERFESIKGQVNHLQGTLDAMEGHWRGIGANAFNTKQTEINEHMVKIGNLLMWFLENINATRKDKDNLEQEIQAALRGIDAGGATSALNSY